MNELAISGGEPALSGKPRLKPLFDDSKIKDEIYELITQKSLSSLFGDYEVGHFESQISKLLGCSHTVAVNSGTSSLHCALQALDIKEGDEVAVTCFSFIASASVIHQVGAKPLFIDIDPNTLNLDPQDLKRKISSSTRAVILVHIFGTPADVSATQQICSDHNLYLIEDAAQALGAKWEGRPLGTFGDAGCFSLNVNKIIQTGEGGLFVTNNGKLAETVRELRVNGLSPFGIERLGFNYTMPNINAYIGIKQLEELGMILTQRAHYAEILRSTLCKHTEILYENRPESTRVDYTVPFLLPERLTPYKEIIYEALIAEGVPLSGLYSLLYNAPFLNKMGTNDDCPIGNSIVPRILSILPHHRYFEEDVYKIAHGIDKVFTKIDSLIDANKKKVAINSVEHTSCSHIE